VKPRGVVEGEAEGCSRGVQQRGEAEGRVREVKSRGVVERWS
jgi:hypothetical protein